MKKQALKTIFRDFFRLKYPLAMIVFIVILGAGIVLASVSSNLLNGLHLIYQNEMEVNDTNGILGACQIVNNNTGSGGITPVDYFIPTRTKGEWDAFKANLPANVTLSDCPPITCNPGYYPLDGNCVICPKNYYCNNNTKNSCPVSSYGNQYVSASGSDSVNDCVCNPSYPCGEENCYENDCDDLCNYQCSNYNAQCLDNVCQVL